MNPAGTMELRVVSYNLRKGKGARGNAPHHRAVVGEIGRRLAERRPDILLCQEVFHGHRGRRVSQSSVLAERLGTDHRYEANATYARGHHGNATLCRHRIAEHRVYDISTNPVEKRGALYTRIDAGRRPVHVLNVHLGLNRWQRRRQIVKIARILESHARPGDPVLLGGDFNDWTGFLDPFVIGTLGLTNVMHLLSARERRTWHSRRPLFSLDRLYVRNIEPREVRVLAGAPWDRLSDHLPIEVVLA